MSKTEAEVREGHKMTELGPFPEDWGLAELGELFEIRQGKAMSPKSREGERQQPFLRTANVLWGELDLTTLDQMQFSQEEVERLSVAPGDLLICEGGEVGRTAMWEGQVDLCCYQNHIHRLRARDATVEPRFYMYWMQAAVLQLGLYRGEANITTISNLSKGRLSRFSVPVPPLVEQRGIAAVLSAVQEAKEKTEGVIRAAKALKKSLMKHLFTYGPVPVDEAENVPLKETEIGEIREEWAVSELGAHLAVNDAGVWGEDPEDDDAVEVLRSTNMQEGRWVFEDVAVRKLTESQRKRCLLLGGDVLVTKSSGSRAHIGKCAYVDEQVASREACFSNFMQRLRFTGDVDPRFGYLFMLGPGRLQLLEMSTTTTGLRNLRKGDFEQVNLPVPPLHEQQKIGNLLFHIDEKIAAEEDCKRALEELFKTLLNDLMTTKIRVQDLEVGSERAYQICGRDRVGVREPG